MPSWVARLLPCLLPTNSSHPPMLFAQPCLLWLSCSQVTGANVGASSLLTPTTEVAFRSSVPLGKGAFKVSACPDFSRALLHSDTVVCYPRSTSHCSAGTAILICWEMAYLAHDSSSMLNFGRAASRAKKPELPLIFLHHLPLLLLLPFYFLYEKGDFYITCMFLQASSTPLLHGRFMLRRSSMNGSVTHKTCSMLLLLVFFLVRVALWPVLLITHARAASLPAHEALKVLPVPCIAVSCTALFLNCSWWMMLVSGVVSTDLRARYDPGAAVLSTRKED